MTQEPIPHIQEIPDWMIKWPGLVGNKTRSAKTETGTGAELGSIQPFRFRHEFTEVLMNKTKFYSEGETHHCLFNILVQKFHCIFSSKNVKTSASATQGIKDITGNILDIIL